MFVLASSVRSIVTLEDISYNLTFYPVFAPPSPLSTQVSSTSRTPAEISMDGHEPSIGHNMLSPGQSVKVRLSPYPIPCLRRTSVANLEASSQPRPDRDVPDCRSDDWVRDINTLLQFNAAFRNKTRHFPKPSPNR